uniref:Ras-related protein O-RAL (Trinotate prediction) n=1 Tax=Myxobolus squamalis TaxID=59785 RepID=A0A6B2G038_MYXSQ
MATEQKIPVKVVVIGTGGVGKTSLITYYMYKEFVEAYEPTKSDLYRQNVKFNSNEFDLNIIDTAGQESYAHIQDQTIRESSFAILVFSLTERKSFEICTELREFVQRVKDTDYPHLVLVGNKCDIVEEKPNLRAVSISEAQSLCEQWKASYFETSAKTGLNVDNIFMSAIEYVSSTLVVTQEVASNKKSKKNKRKCNIL